MNKRKICLLIAALGTLSVMLALSAVTAQPAIAQTPTPTFWLECVMGYYTTDGSSQHAWTDGPIISYTSDITGVINSFDSWSLPSGSASDMRAGGCAWMSEPVIHPPGEGTIDPVKCCDYGGGAACNAIGYDYAGGINESIHENGIVNGGYAWDKPGAWWNSHVCAIHYSPPPTVPVPECGTGEITDTHFISNSWTPSGAFWYYSFYAINPGGTVSKMGRFIDQYGEEQYGGEYLVNIIARSAITGVLNISAGGAATPITVTGSSSFHEYSGTLTMVGDGSGYTPVVMANASGALITVDRICLEKTGILSCGVINDYHFKSSTSWIHGGPTEWTLNDPIFGTPSGIWRIDSGGYIGQSIAISASGTYSVMAQVRQVYAGPTTELSILINDNEVGSLSYTGNSAWSVVTTTLTLDSLYGSLELVPTDGTLIDWFCIEPGNVTVFGYPCGITAADIANSSLYIPDSKFDEGNTFPIPGGFVGVGPLSFNIGGFSAYLLTHWQSFNPSQWWMTLIGLEIDGAYRVREGGPALGLMPSAYMKTGQYLTSDISGDYNVVLRMKPKYQNAHLYVNGVEAPNGVYQEWSDASVYVNGNVVELSSDCGGLLNGCTPQNGTIDVVEVDDVYVVPGSALTCGTTTPLTTPIGSCINPNPDFMLGGQDWQLSNGAYIDNVYGWAVLPGGSLIQQQVPTGGTWQQASQGINLGYSYVIAVGAHLEHSNAPGQYTVMVGASQPGQLSFNHQLVDVTSMESTDMFTVTSDMLNGTSLDIRIANEAGGTVMLDYVCIRYNGGPGILPPVGQCLGSWTTSDGSGNAVGPEIPANNYVKNQQAAMGGGYALDLAGATDDVAGSTFTLQYCNATSGICDEIGAIPLEQNFASSLPFVVPAGGYYGGELRLNNDDAVIYSNLCLRQSQNGPPNQNPPSPPALPIPECGLIYYTNPLFGWFYMHAPYSVTNEFTGTEYTAAYLSEMIYNYATYPLVCTTVSIANWQFRAYTEFKIYIGILFAALEVTLAAIIALLVAILAKIPMIALPPLCGVLDIILWVIKALLEVLFKILLMIFQTLGLIVKIFSGMANEARGENAIMYPINCSGDGQWMCFMLAGIAELDWKLGDWLNTISLIVVAMLTVSLAFWVTNQVRDMMQPGSGGDTSG